MDALQALFLQMETRLGSRIDGVHQQIAETQKKVATLADTVEANDKKTEARLLALEHAAASASPPAEAASWPLPGAASSSTSSALPGLGGGRPRDRGKAPAGAGAPSPASHRKSVKVLALGFQREVPRAALTKHWDKVKALCSPAIVADTKVLAGTGKAYSVLFPTSAAATAFTRLLRDNKIDTTWQGSGDPQPTHINFRIEKTPEEHHVGVLFSPFFLRVKTAVMGSDGWKDNFRFYLDCRRGLLRVESDDEVWTLFTLCEKDGAHTFTYDEAILRRFGLHPNIVREPRAQDTA
jgi:hypothetical protein